MHIMFVPSRSLKYIYNIRIKGLFGWYWPSFKYVATDEPTKENLVRLYKYKYQFNIKAEV